MLSTERRRLLVLNISHFTTIAMRKEVFPIMATVLSDKARVFLREHSFAVLSTINKDGSSQLTTVLFALDDDDTIVLNTQVHSQKNRNLRRDPRIAMCVEGKEGYVSVYGKVVEFIDDQEINRQDIDRLVRLFWTGDEESRQQYVAHTLEHPRISYRFKCEKVTESWG
jgi:PPOX class probable F420-dependent enzyme